MHKDQSAEIAVPRYQDAPVVAGGVQEFGIGKPRKSLLPGGDHVVPHASQNAGCDGIDVLVE